MAIAELITRRRFTVDEYHRMAEAGILHEDDRVELLEGEIVEMSPIGWRHQACVDRLNRWLVPALRDRAILRPQGPIRLSPDSEPQPDLVVLRPRADFYAEGGPGPEDVLWLVEISDTSLRYDRDVKVPLYARYGIPEVWVVDLVEERVLVYRDPHPAEGYRSVQVLGRGARLAPQAFPDLELAVDEILA
uniref:Uma2 family endonuclease n=1 Tax=Thermorudis peleae TaxID=1382356 RepID=A0A831TF58_9BACT